MRPLLMVALVCFAAAPARTEEPPDPPVCAEAIAAKPDSPPLEALKEAEKLRMRKMKEAQRESRRLAKEGLGTADGTGSRRRMRDLDAIERRRAGLYREAKALCLCRERRGDPYREDCQQLYPQTLR